MISRKFLNGILSLMVLASLVFGGNVQANAMPSGPTDESKVPHYFGPYPNWANSPLTTPNATVTISGDGSGATAEAIVGANGSVTGINITDPGSGYTAATVAISGAGTGANADAVVTLSGIVTGVVVSNGGSGYTAPVVTISGGGGITQATATAFGGIDNLNLVAGGSGYTFPTVDFDMPDDPNGIQAKAHAVMDANGSITSVVLDEPGSGYATAPKVIIRDGTLFDPIPNGGTGAEATSTLTIQAVVVDTFGAGYTSAPSVAISDPNPAFVAASANALTDAGGVTGITNLVGGSDYLSVGIRKFVDTLPLVGPGGANNLGNYIPVAVADTTTFPGADYYVIGVVQYRQKLHSDLPETLLRGYVQLSTTGTGVALTNAMLDGSTVPALMPNGTQAYGVDKPHYLGPTIVAQKDRPVRITFYNLLPTGVAGDLFLPVDTTMMGSGEANMDMMYDPIPNTGGDVMDALRNPMCTEKYDDPMMRAHCFTENRATLHLHGGNVPWISDGTPHQWITPAGESTSWPQGVSVQSVPDMVANPKVPDCSSPNDGCQTFYYTNQQSARLMFYHDHAWGITRLNVYAGEAAGYLLQDSTEQALVNNGTIPADVLPLVIQDRTFVPDAAQLALQDPTWDAARWGTKGSFWYHHVYMPAQNPGDPSGMSAYGRWMYGPWFWPPAGDAKNGPIANPYYDPACNLDNPATWQYQTDPFCEPQLIPGTPNISVGMEQFNDTPLVNGAAYPTVTLEPRTYRFRMLNAANDRFFNFQWYVADPTTASTGLNSLGQVIGGTEVAFKAAELAAAQTDPNVFPTPDTTISLSGPDWIQIGTEGGFLPAPVVVDGQQVTTWITDPTRFDVGNVDQHSLLLAPAERADVIVDFSKFAGKTLILYNDAPAAFPARVASYDYYTGAPDLSPIGAPKILPGYGPNTRTIMQVKIAGTAAPAFNLSKLQAAFRHNASGTGVFESGQHPIVVGQSAYNSAYGTSFAASGWCNSPTSNFKCDGFARINQQGGDTFTFDTLKGAISGTWAKISLPFQPKAIHDEMNSTNFDEYGRMQATLGVEVVPATPGLQNVVLSPYIFPTTELIDTTKLPKAAAYDTNTGQFTDVKVTPIATADDGTQIWKITHNGVDTHPIHFHATDVQVINRVTWDNIVIPPDATELGWKETVRVSPLEDTIVAMRPVTPTLPFDFPNSIRLLSPMMPDGAAIDLSSQKDANGLGMTAFAPSGDPIDIYNHYVNFGAEYVYHCHILSHEEMDMMHAVLYAFPPMAPVELSVAPPTGSGNSRRVNLTWKDNSRSETAWEIQRSTSVLGPWTTIGSIPTATMLGPTTGQSIGGTVTYSDVIGSGNQSYAYRVLAVNVVGDTWDYADPGLNEIVSGGFPTVTTKSTPSNTATWVSKPAAPSNLVATLASGPQINLTWTDNATNEVSFVVERSINGGAFAQIATPPARNNTGSVSFVDTAVLPGTNYSYRVAAVNAAGFSNYATSASVSVPALPAIVTSFTATANPAVAGTNTRSVTLNWTYNGTVIPTGFTIQRSTNSSFTGNSVNTVTVGNVRTFTQTGLSRSTSYYYRIRTNNGTIIFTGYVNAAPFPVTTVP